MIVNFDNHIMENGRIMEHSIDWYLENKPKYETDNPCLWQGQYWLLAPILGGYEFNDNKNLQKFYKFYNSCQVDIGLHTRYPGEYLESKDFNSTSVDEHNGISFLAAATKDFHYLNSIISYGEKNNWCFYEKMPGVDPYADLKKPTKLIPFLRNIYKVFKAMKKEKDMGGSSRVDKVIFQNETTTILSRIRLPKDRAFLRIISPDHEPTFIGKMHLIASFASTIISGKKSGRNMMFFKLLAFHHVGYEPRWVRLIKSNFAEKVDMTANSNMFYRKGHPFIECIDRIVNERYTK